MQEKSSTFPIRILHLEDSEIDHQLVCRTLERSEVAFTMQRVETLQDFTERLQSNQTDAILADYRLPGFTAIDAWEALSKQTVRPPFILLSGAIGEAAAVQAIKLGMSDYLLKDDLSKLAQVIHRSIELQTSRIAKELADKNLAASERQLADFAEHLQMKIEQERAAIAREIHDDIGGSLAAIKFDLAWIQRHTHDPATLAHINTASEMLQHALGASQRIMMDLRPAILDQGLVAALEWLCAGFEKRTHTRTSLRCTPLKAELSKAIQLAAYRTAQEALTNVSKHSQCKQVSIELSDAEGVLTLEISDDGEGMSNLDREKPKAFGLKGLHERAKSVGGWLDVSTRSGQGTSIILSIPLACHPHAATQEAFQ
jgi:signal transduction histidine kinase